MFNFCMNCDYLSVNRVTDIGENSIFSSQHRSVLRCVSPIIYLFVCKQYHVFISCAVVSHSSFIRECIILCFTCRAIFSEINGLASKMNQLSFRLSVSCHDKTTTPSSDGGGNLIFLDRHGVDCGTGYLAYFRLLRPDSGQVHYKYRCCSVTQTKG